MGFNGSGSWTRQHNWVTDKNASIKITASRMDAEFDDMASGLSQCIVKDGQQDPTANLPMATFKHTNVGAASARTEYLDGGSYQDGQAYVWGGVASGASAITINLNPTISAYTTGMKVGFVAVGANASACTLNADGVSAAALVKGKNEALAANDIVSGGAYWAVYKGADGFQLLNVMEENPVYVTLQTTGLATLGNVLCSGSAVFTSSLNVTGAATFSGAVDMTDDLDVDNLNLNGNAITSTDANGDVDISPNGTGGLTVGGYNLFAGYINGLQMSNGTDTTNDIDIATGVCLDSAGVAAIGLTSGLTKQIDANWAVGTDAGGFPSGLTIADLTWYHVFLIKRTDTGVVDAGFDTSLTATNLLTDASDYDLYRRIGSVIRVSSSIYQFTQIGDTVYWDVSIIDVSAAAGVTTRTLRTLTTPSDVRCKAIMNIDMEDSGAASDKFWLLYPPDLSDTTPSASAFTLSLRQASTALFRASSSMVHVDTNTSSQVYERFSSTDLTHNIVTVGYVDYRGKD